MVTRQFSQATSFPNLFPQRHFFPIRIFPKNIFISNSSKFIEISKSILEFIIVRLIKALTRRKLDRNLSHVTFFAFSCTIPSNSSYLGKVCEPQSNRHHFSITGPSKKSPISQNTALIQHHTLWHSSARGSLAPQHLVSPRHKGGPAKKKTRNTKPKSQPGKAQVLRIGWGRMWVGHRLARARAR